MALQKKENVSFAGLLITVVLILPLVISENIDCNGKAFYCVNSTHFKICVDLGGGVSKTVDDFLISCPRNTVCKDDNYFECEYRLTTTSASITFDVTNVTIGPSDTNIIENVEITTEFPEYQSNKLEELRNDQNASLSTEELRSTLPPINIVSDSLTLSDIVIKSVNISSKNNLIDITVSDNITNSATVSSAQITFESSTSANDYSTPIENIILNENVTDNIILKTDLNNYHNLTQLLLYNNTESSPVSSNINILNGTSHENNTLKESNISFIETTSLLTQKEINSNSSDSENTTEIHLENSNSTPMIYVQNDPNFENILGKSSLSTHMYHTTTQTILEQINDKNDNETKNSVGTGYTTDSKRDYLNLVTENVETHVGSNMYSSSTDLNSIDYVDEFLTSFTTDINQYDVTQTVPKDIFQILNTTETATNLNFTEQINGLSNVTTENTLVQSSDFTDIFDSTFTTETNEQTYSINEESLSETYGIQLRSEDYPSTIDLNSIIRNDYLTPIPISTNIFEIVGGTETSKIYEEPTTNINILNTKLNSNNNSSISKIDDVPLLIANTENYYNDFLTSISTDKNQVDTTQSLPTNILEIVSAKDINLKSNNSIGFSTENYKEVFTNFADVNDTDIGPTNISGSTDSFTVKPFDYEAKLNSESIIQDSSISPTDTTLRVSNAADLSLKENASLPKIDYLLQLNNQRFFIGNTTSDKPQELANEVSTTLYDTNLDFGFTNNTMNILDAEIRSKLLDLKPLHQHVSKEIQNIQTNIYSTTEHNYDQTTVNNFSKSMTNHNVSNTTNDVLVNLTIHTLETGLLKNNSINVRTPDLQTSNSSNQVTYQTILVKSSINPSSNTTSIILLDNVTNNISTSSNVIPYIDNFNNVSSNNIDSADIIIFPMTAELHQDTISNINNTANKITDNVNTNINEISASTPSRTQLNPTINRLETSSGNSITTLNLTPSNNDNVVSMLKSTSLNPYQKLESIEKSNINLNKGIPNTNSNNIITLITTKYLNESTIQISDTEHKGLNNSSNDSIYNTNRNLGNYILSNLSSLVVKLNSNMNQSIVQDQKIIGNTTNFNKSFFYVTTDKENISKIENTFLKINYSQINKSELINNSQGRIKNTPTLNNRNITYKILETDIPLQKLNTEDVTISKLVSLIRLKNDSVLKENQSTSDTFPKIIYGNEFKSNKTVNNFNTSTRVVNNNHNSTVLQKQNVIKSYEQLIPLSNTDSNKNEQDNSSSTMNLTNSMKRNEPITQFTCANRKHGKYVDENNCNKFYICIGKFEPIIGMCPIDTVFSGVKKQCTKNLSHCIRNNQFRCSSVGRFIDILTEEFYFICVKNNDGYVRYKLQCQKGYRLNKTNIQCVYDSSSIDISKNQSDHSNNDGKSSESMQLSTNKKLFKCVKEGKFEYPDDCRKYYLCTKKKLSEFRRKIKKCGSDEVFNKEKRKCTDADSYDC